MCLWTYSFTVTRRRRLRICDLKVSKLKIRNSSAFEWNIRLPRGIDISCINNRKDSSERNLTSNQPQQIVNRSLSDKYLFRPSVIFWSFTRPPPLQFTVYYPKWKVDFLPFTQFRKCQICSIRGESFTSSTNSSD